MSKRKAKRKLDAWNKYFRKYEPWHLATPGMTRAYDQCTREYYARMRNAK